MGKPKYFVLDTNVLLHNASAITHFGDNHIVIPISVIEEIDRFKKDVSETGRNARMASRLIDELRKRGPLSRGVPLDNGGTLRIEIRRDEKIQLNGLFEKGKMDNRILEVALGIKAANPDTRTILVTKDTNLRIKADALNLETQDFENAKVRIEDLYSGTGEITVPAATINELYGNGGVALTAADPPPYPNQFFTLIDETNPDHTALCRVHKRGMARPVRTLDCSIYCVIPRNREQRYAFDVLLDDAVRLVTLVGKAGTGKTLLALAAALQKTLIDRSYTRILVTRPIFPLGRDLGFLPGDLETKLTPWMQPIFDNLEFLLASPKGKPAEYKRVGDLFDSGMIEMEALTYIRGRSIPNQFLIIDEAQNLTPHEIKTVITRVGENTKIVVTGDPYQIDHPYVDASSNGLSYLVERMKGQEVAGHVTLVKGERSPLAELAANLL